MYKLYNGDCLEVMKDIPNKSIDMILCDLPYGTTACKWDVIIPYEPLWEQYNRIIKDNAAVVLFGSEPFSTKLRNSNLKMYRYDWVWNKTMCSNFMNAKKQPKKLHENILVFYKKQPTYNPQFEKGEPYKDKRNERWLPKNYSKDSKNIKIAGNTTINNKGIRYPSSVIKFSNSNHNNVHPTQKPVPLLEYLIKTYTNENELVLDNCMGSGSTGVAALNTNRRFIGIEKEKKYFEIAKERIEKEGEE